MPPGVPRIGARGLPASVGAGTGVALEGGLLDRVACTDAERQGIRCRLNQRVAIEQRGERDQRPMRAIALHGEEIGGGNGLGDAVRPDAVALVVMPEVQIAVALDTVPVLEGAHHRQSGPGLWGIVARGRGAVLAGAVGQGVHAMRGQAVEGAPRADRLGARRSASDRRGTGSGTPGPGHQLRASTFTMSTSRWRLLFLTRVPRRLQAWIVGLGSCISGDPNVAVQVHKTVSRGAARESALDSAISSTHARLRRPGNTPTTLTTLARRGDQAYRRCAQGGAGRSTGCRGSPPCRFGMP